MALIFKKPPKRKAGQRAGLTRANPQALLTPGRTGSPSEVGATTIRAHVKGGIAELRREVAGRALAALTPPYKPNQDPKDYLEAFFRAALASFRQRPKMGRLVVLELTDDPLLSLMFAERMCATIAGLDAKTDLFCGLELLIGRLTEATMIESGAWAQSTNSLRPKYRPGY